MRSPFLLALLPLAALAAPAAATPLLLRYEVRAAGVQVMVAEAHLDLDLPGDRYRVEVASRTTGLAGALASSNSVAVAEGAWRGNQARPARFRSAGTWRGEARAIGVDWDAAGQATPVGLVPPNEGERRPVPEAQRRDTLDGLSALMRLTRLLATTGRCDATEAVYDGRRRSDVVVRTSGTQALPAGGAFAGPALRCVMVSRLVSGHRLEDDVAAEATPRETVAWLAAPIPGGPVVPVQVELPTRWFGTVRARLVAAEPLPGPLAQHPVQQLR